MQHDDASGLPTVTITFTPQDLVALSDALNQRLQSLAVKRLEADVNGDTGAVDFYGTQYRATAKVRKALTSATLAAQSK